MSAASPRHPIRTAFVEGEAVPPSSRLARRAASVRRRPCAGSSTRNSPTASALGASAASVPRGAEVWALREGMTGRVFPWQRTSDSHRRPPGQEPGALLAELVHRHASAPCPPFRRLLSDRMRHCDWRSPWRALPEGRDSGSSTRHPGSCDAALGFHLSDSRATGWDSPTIRLESIGLRRPRRVLPVTSLRAEAPVWTTVPALPGGPTTGPPDRTAS